MATTTKKTTTAKPAAKKTTTTKPAATKDVLSALKKAYDEVEKEGDLYVVKLNKKWGFVDKNGKVLISPRFDGIEACFTEGAMTTWDYAHGVGFVNDKGKEIAKPIYKSSRAFKNGMAAVFDGKKWGFIDKSGKVVVPLKYDEVESFNGDKAKVKLAEKELYIDKKGKTVDDTKKTTSKHSVVKSATTSRPAVKKATTSKPAATKDVLSALKKAYDEVEKEGDLYVVKLNKKWGFVDKNGKVLISPRFDGIEACFTEGAMTTWDYAHGVGFVNDKGKEIAKPIYKSSRAFKNGMAAVFDGKKWGFIDKSGKVVVPLKYDEVESFNGDKAKVKLGTRELYIDKKGKLLNKK